MQVTSNLTGVESNHQSPLPLLHAKQIHKLFGRKEVLSQIDITIYPHEIITIIGLNGSGKTTLLKILLGLEEPTSGDVIRREGLRIGYVPQSITFDSILPMTVLGFLRLMAKDSHKITAVAEELEILPYINRQLYALSGGELQRVLLAQALLVDPHLLVLDEPVQGVDFGSQAQLYQLIRKVSTTRECAVLMVSHDLHLVMADTDRVICLNRHICCSGTPFGVSRDPEFIALFGKDVANQVALYVHHHDHQHDTRGDVVQIPHTHSHDCEH
jgi:zinc transport system ATP-binding protein